MKDYTIHGFIASGTYGRVFKASKSGKFYAVKKFLKLSCQSTSDAQKGVSLSAIREISICKEMKNEYVVQLLDIFLDLNEKTISLVFEYAEHDLLQILHYHAYNLKQTPIPEYSVKSFLLQLIKGVEYLHSNYIMHRDLKPANILVTVGGIVKIADLGLARVYNEPIQPLFNTDKVVVTIWYRAPELLLGSRHYTPAIDLWAIGCIFAELFLLRPIFKGEEVKVDSKKRFPFQRDQLKKIISILGCPTTSDWRLLSSMPDYEKLVEFSNLKTSNLARIYSSFQTQSQSGLKLLQELLEYDPEKRSSPANAINHPYFKEMPIPSEKYTFFHLIKKSCLQSPYSNQRISYPLRKISVEGENASFYESVPQNL